MVFLNSPNILALIWLITTPIIFIGTWIFAYALLHAIKEQKQSQPDFLSPSLIWRLRILSVLQIIVAFLPLPYAGIISLIALGNSVTMGSSNSSLSYPVFLIFSVIATVILLFTLHTLHHIKKASETNLICPDILRDVKRCRRIFLNLSTINSVQYIWLLLLTPFAASFASPDGKLLARFVSWPSLPYHNYMVVNSANQKWLSHWLSVYHDNPCKSLVWSVNSSVVFCRSKDRYTSAYDAKTDGHYNHGLFLDYAFTLDAPPDIPQDLEGKIHYYIQNGASVGNMLFSAIDIGDASAVNVLLKFVTDVNSIYAQDIFPAYDGTTLLEKTIKESQSKPEEMTQIAKMLLKAGADPDYSNSLQQASYTGSYSIIKLLVEYGANVKANGNLAIQSAYGDDKDKIIQYLKEHGANGNFYFPGFPERYQKRIMEYLNAHNVKVEDYLSYTTGPEKENIIRYLRKTSIAD